MKSNKGFMSDGPRYNDKYMYDRGFYKNTSMSLGYSDYIDTSRKYPDYSDSFSQVANQKSYNSKKSNNGSMSDGSRYNDKYMYDRHNVNKDKENMLRVLRQMLGIM